MPKRTKQIDGDREIQLPVKPINGKPVFALAKNLETTPEDKEKLSDNLKAAGIQAQIDRAARDCMAAQEQFLEKTITAIAPPEILEALEIIQGSLNGPQVADAKQRFADWIDASGIIVIRDGMDTVIKLKGQVLGELRFKIDPGIKWLAERELDRRFSSAQWRFPLD